MLLANKKRNLFIFFFYLPNSPCCTSNLEAPSTNNLGSLAISYTIKNCITSRRFYITLRLYEKTIYTHARSLPLKSFVGRFAIKQRRIDCVEIRVFEKGSPLQALVSQYFEVLDISSSRPETGTAFANL